MARINLKVPFAEKDEAKSLGARWDKDLKTWYVPDGVDASLFAKWLHAPVAISNEPKYAIHSPHYFIACSHTACWKCGEQTKVFAFILPEEHQEYVFPEFEGEEGYWSRYQAIGTMSNVIGLEISVWKRLQTFTQLYKPAYSRQAGGRYFMNHCEHCNATQGDFFMHSEPGGAFFPTTEAEAGRITVHAIAEPFEGNGSMSYSSVDFLADMEHATT